MLSKLAAIKHSTHVFMYLGKNTKSGTWSIQQNFIILCRIIILTKIYRKQSTIRNYMLQRNSITGRRTYSMFTKVSVNGGDDAIHLVQLGCLTKYSQSSFINVNCIYHAYNPTRHCPYYIKSFKESRCNFINGAESFKKRRVCKRR